MKEKRGYRFREKEGTAVRVNIWEPQGAPSLLVMDSAWPKARVKGQRTEGREK